MYESIDVMKCSQWLLTNLVPYRVCVLILGAVILIENIAILFSSFIIILVHYWRHAVA
jgi:hypothetical protein